MKQLLKDITIRRMILGTLLTISVLLRHVGHHHQRFARLGGCAG